MTQNWGETMSVIKVIPESVSSIESVVRSQANAMESVTSILMNVINELDMQVASSESIRENLTNLKQRSSQQQQKLEGMDSALIKVNNEFMQADRSLAQRSRNLSRMIDYIRGTEAGVWNSTMTVSATAATAIAALTGITQSGYLSIQESMENINMCQRTLSASTGVKETSVYSSLYDYLNENDPTYLFGGYSFAMAFVGDAKWYEVMGYGMGHAKDILKALFTGRNSDEMASSMMNDPDKCKAILRGMIDDLTGTEYLDVFDSSEETALKEIGKFAKDYGFEDVSDLVDIIQKATGGVEYADRILKDYTENIRMLESLKGVAPNSGVLSQTVDDLIREYKDQFGSDIVDELKKNAEKGIVTNVDALLGTKFSTVNKVCEKAFGSIPAVKGMEKVITTTSMRTDAISSFRNAAQKIQSGNFTESDVQAYQNSFNVAKGLTIEQYKGLLEYYGKNSSKGQYVASELKKLESMTSQDFQYASSYSSKKFSSGAGHGGGGGGGGGF